MVARPSAFSRSAWSLLLYPDRRGARLVAECQLLLSRLVDIAAYFTIALSRLAVGVELPRGRLPWLGTPSEQRGTSLTNQARLQREQRGPQHGETSGHRRLEPHLGRMGRLTAAVRRR